MSRLECDHCGACCTTLIIEIGHLDVVREPRLLESATPCRQDPGESEWDREYVLATGAPGDGCAFHKDGRCSVYPTRPNVCVRFEAGSPDCQRARYYAQLPPLGGGDWPADEDEFCAFIGEDYGDLPVVDLTGGSGGPSADVVIDPNRGN